MSARELTRLLCQIRDGAASDAECARVVDLLRGDDRVPAGVREGLFVDDPAGDAAGLLALLGADPSFRAALTSAVAAEAGGVEVALDDAWRPVRAALQRGIEAEAGQVELADAVLARTGLRERAVPLAEAVAAEAGQVEVADRVLARAGRRAAQVPVAAAVRAGAGTIDVADAVLQALDLHESPLPVAEAVVAEAGEVDLADRVEWFTTDMWASAMLDGELPPAARQVAGREIMRHARRGEALTAFADLGREVREAVSAQAGAVDLWAEVAGDIGVEDPDEVPGWRGDLLAEAVRAEAGEVDLADAVEGTVRRNAAAVAVTVPEPANRPLRRWVPALAAVAAAALVAVFVGRAVWQSPDLREVVDLQFASADEIVVDDLSYGEDAMVQVFQSEGDNAPLIIWVEDLDDGEEATL